MPLLLRRRGSCAGAQTNAGHAPGKTPGKPSGTGLRCGKLSANVLELLRFPTARFGILAGKIGQSWHRTIRDFEETVMSSDERSIDIERLRSAWAMIADSLRAAEIADEEVQTARAMRDRQASYLASMAHE